jgi:hypothetical protein
LKRLLVLFRLLLFLLIFSLENDVLSSVPDLQTSPKEPLISSARRGEFYRNSILEAWSLLTMKLLSRQGSSWSNLTTVIHLAASYPTPMRRNSLPGEEGRLSRLTMARKKSLTLQEMMSPHWGRRRRASELSNPVEVIDNSSDEGDVRASDEDDEFYERRAAVGDDPVVFNPVTLQAFDSITNQEYNTLGPLLNDAVHYDILGALAPNIRDTLTDDDLVLGHKKTLSSLIQPLTTLSLVLAEVISTEAKFVADIYTLNSLLYELRYSTLTSVRQFVDSKYYTGISTAAETLKITHSQFLKDMQSFHSQAKAGGDGGACDTHLEEEFKVLFGNTMDHCQVIFDAFVRFTPFFSLFSQFIVNHDGLSLLCQTLSLQDEQFKLFLQNCEKNVNEQMMSLIIKPVQRLPRYVLLTKEIQHRLKKFKIIHEEIRALEKQLEEQGLAEGLPSEAPKRFTMCISRFQRACELEEASNRVLQMMTDCAQDCNTFVRQHQDNLRMHQLHDMYKEAGVDLNLVARDRMLLKEGELIRQHRGSTETHLIQLFSDQLITASKTLRGLKLQRRFPLTKNSNLLCLPVPPKIGSGSILRTCFVLIADDKTIFFEAKSPAEMMEWVSLIRQQLVHNGALRDIYAVKTQLSLINSLIVEIKRRAGAKGIHEGVKESHQSIHPVNQFNESHLKSVHTIQTGWWHLLSILEDFTNKSGEQNLAHHFKRLIEKQSKEVVSQLLLTIVDKKKSEATPIRSLLFNNSLHYFITSGVVFEYQAPCAVTGVEIYDRPLLMKLFLLSDILIGTYIETANDPVTYSFHILMQDLEFSDQCLDGSANALALIDQSKPIKRRLSLLSFGNVECTKRIIFTSSAEEKFEWMSLLTLCKKGFDNARSSTTSSTVTRDLFNKIKSNSFKTFSEKMTGDIVWEYEQE